MFDSLYFKKKTKENDKMLNMFILGARFTDVCYIMICTLLKLKKKKIQAWAWVVMPPCGHTVIVLNLKIQKFCECAPNVILSIIN